MNIYFDHLPVEIRMMIFDHLVINKYSLGIICLISHNWKTITQNSYAWKLWVNAILGRKYDMALDIISDSYKIFFNPIYDVQFVPDNILSTRVKILLTKKFIFSFFDNADINDVKSKILAIWHSLFVTGNLQLIQMLQKIFNITTDDARDMNNYALRLVCRCGNLSILKYLYTTFYLTVDDARSYNNYALRYACENGHIEVIKCLYTMYKLTTDDARYTDNITLRLASANGYLPIVKYLRTAFNLTTDDARAKNNSSLCLASANGHLEVVKYLHSAFSLTIDDARANDNSSLRFASQNGHLSVIKYLHT